MLSKQKKVNALKTGQRHDQDLAKHLKKHQKDFHSRRGLLQMVADRRKHLKYIAKKDEKGFEKLTAKLGLKK
jgi:small subunit ribosomal protein S15